MARSNPADNVFINCPFDAQFKPILQAIIFAVIDCGFVVRCSLEIDDSSEVRIDKIYRLMGECKFGIHDISRTELDRKTRLPRFNMPFELGVFLGAKRFGNKKQREKSCLILDKEPYRYQSFISDIGGQDIRPHNGNPTTAIARVRDFLNSTSRRKTIPGGIQIGRRYKNFSADLPRIARRVGLKKREITFGDFSKFVYSWLKKNVQG